MGKLKTLPLLNDIYTRSWPPEIDDNILTHIENNRRRIETKMNSFKIGDTVEIYKKCKHHEKRVFTISEIHPSGYWVKDGNGIEVPIWIIRKHHRPSKK